MLTGMKITCATAVLMRLPHGGTLDEGASETSVAQPLLFSTRRYDVVTESVYDPRDAPDRQRMLFNGPAGGMPQVQSEPTSELSSSQLRM